MVRSKIEWSTEPDQQSQQVLGALSKRSSVRSSAFQRCLPLAGARRSASAMKNWTRSGMLAALLTRFRRPVLWLYIVNLRNKLEQPQQGIHLLIRSWQLLVTEWRYGHHRRWSRCAFAWLAALLSMVYALNASESIQPSILLLELIFLTNVVLNQNSTILRIGYRVGFPFNTGSVQSKLELF